MLNRSHDRDPSVERLLRQSFKTPDRGVTDACLDAESIAAWIDGGLSGTALELAQSHVADCARCRAIVGGIVRTATILPRRQPARRAWVAWLVPAAAAATAVALWVAVPREAEPPAPPATAVQQSAEARPVEPPAVDRERPQDTRLQERQAPDARKEAPNTTQGQASLRKDAGRRETDQLNEQESRSKADLAAAAPAEKSAEARGDTASPPGTPPAPAPVTQDRFVDRSANTLARAAAFGTVIVSPDPAIRWRIAGSTVEQSTNGGGDWRPVSTGVATQLTAGVAPSASVCWVVGQAGMVLRSTDGRTFSQLPFPERVDLSAVRAIDAQSATVTTLDGRTFETTDGGVAWRRQ